MNEKVNKRIMEMFRGRRNVFTVLLMLLGSYLIILPTAKSLIDSVGNSKAVLVGMGIFLLGYFLSDALHKK